MRIFIVVRKQCSFFCIEWNQYSMKRTCCVFLFLGCVILVDLLRFRWHLVPNERSLHRKPPVDGIFSFDRRIDPTVDDIMFVQIQRVNHVFREKQICFAKRKKNIERKRIDSFVFLLVKTCSITKDRKWKSRRYLSTE